MTSEPFISVSACAREIGVHKSTLASQIRDGSIRSHDGKVLLSEVLADRANNIDLSRSARRAGKIDNANAAGGSGDSDNPKNISDPPNFDPPEEAGPDVGLIVDGKAMSYHDARALKETYLARLRRLEYDLKAGEVVLIEDALWLLRQMLARVKNKLLGVPSRVAPRLAALRSPEAVHALLSGEIETILLELVADAKPPTLPTEPTRTEDHDGLHAAIMKRARRPK